MIHRMLHIKSAAVFFKFFFFLTDIIDENLKTALQKDLNAMAPGLTIQVFKYIYM